MSPVCRPRCLAPPLHHVSTAMGGCPKPRERRSRGDECFGQQTLNTEGRTRRSAVTVDGPATALQARREWSGVPESLARPGDTGELASGRQRRGRDAPARRTGVGCEVWRRAGLWSRWPDRKGWRNVSGRSRESLPWRGSVRDMPWRVPVAIGSPGAGRHSDGKAASKKEGQTQGTHDSLSGRSNDLHRMPPTLLGWPRFVPASAASVSSQAQQGVSLAIKKCSTTVDAA